MNQQVLERYQFSRSHQKYQYRSTSSIQKEHERLNSVITINHPLGKLGGEIIGSLASIGLLSIGEVGWNFTDYVYNQAPALESQNIILTKLHDLSGVAIAFGILFTSLGINQIVKSIQQYTPVKTRKRIQKELQFRR